MTSLYVFYGEDLDAPQGCVEINGMLAAMLDELQNQLGTRQRKNHYVVCGRRFRVAHPYELAECLAGVNVGKCRSEVL